MNGTETEAATEPTDQWYKRAVIYALDVETFSDSGGDGIGDFQGARSRLDYLVDLGLTCLWLTPFYPTPNGDNGYDVSDYLSIDPRLGTLDDFRAFCRDARSRGLHIMVDLVVNHTSKEHPWFQAARSHPRSPYRRFYLWSDQPEPPAEPIVFPGDQPGSVWAYDEMAGAFYRHQFYEFEPDLATGHPEVGAEIERIMDFWMAQEIDGFRIDAASHMGGRSDGRRVVNGDPHELLRRVRAFADARRPSVALMGEADAEPSHLQDFFGDDNELHMLLNFLLDNYLFLALARQEAEPLAHILRTLPKTPPTGQWANFVRNFDELDLERLTDEERQEVYDAFAPEPEMRIYGRGIRRRLAPMLGGDQRRIAMVMSLLMTLPGTPVILYGDEIGMGDDLSLPERVSVRTPMQWSDAKNGGFSTAPRDRLALPVIEDGPYAYSRVNVAAQQGDDESLLCRVRRAIHTCLRCPEFTISACTVLDVDHPSVLAHRSDPNEAGAGPDGELVVALHNLADQPATVTVALPDHSAMTEVLSNRTYDPPQPQPQTDADGSSARFALDGYGYRWFRLAGKAEARSPSRAE